MSDPDFFDLAARQQWDATPGHRTYSDVTGHLDPLTSGDKASIDQLAGNLRRAAQSSAPAEERCVLTELPKPACSHCRTGRRPAATVGGKWRLIKARFPGNCAVCGVGFEARQTIARLEDGGYAGPCCRDGAGQ